MIAMSCGITVGNIVGGFMAARLIAPYGWSSVFIVGGAAPLILLPLLAFMLPESAAFLATRGKNRSAIAGGKNPVGMLFSGGFARVTVLLWIINFLSLLTIYFINSWLPSMLHTLGIATVRAIIAATMFHVGGLVGAAVSGFTVGKLGAERVLAAMLLFGCVCLLLIGLTDVSVFVLGCFIFGSGAGISAAQLGINSLPGGLYPPVIRSTGTGWALGFGRLGNVADLCSAVCCYRSTGRPSNMLLSLCIPTSILALTLMALSASRASRGGALQSANRVPELAQPLAGSH